MAGDLAEKADLDLSRREGCFDLEEAVTKVKNLEPGKFVYVGGTANDKGSYERLVKRVWELTKCGLNIGASGNYGFLVVAEDNFRRLLIYRRQA